jgi:cephalosporin hydroxylase
MLQTTLLRSTGLALGSALLLSGVLLGCSGGGSKPQPVGKAEAAEEAEAEGDEATPPKKGKKDPKAKGKTRSHKYAGQDEAEVERSIDSFEEIDQWSLKLRKKQPIYFLGLPMRQIPTDNWLMSELMYEVKPDYIIEAGTLYGGSAVYYAAMLEFINPDGKVLTVDINEEQIHAEAKANPLWDKRVKFYLGSSIAPEVHEQLKAEIGEGKRVFVTIDTLHAPKHVASELELYSQYVTSGGYMILQDTYYEGLPEVIDEFLKNHPDWEQVSKLDDRFIFTKYRGGFLRKKGELPARLAPTPAPEAAPVPEGEAAPAPAAVEEK